MQHQVLDQVHGSSSYLCLWCKATFPVARAYLISVNVRTHYLGEPGFERALVPSCRGCGSTDLQAVHRCVVCGQHEPTNGSDACIDCVEADQDAAVARDRARETSLREYELLEQARTYPKQVKVDALGIQLRKLRAGGAL